MPFHFNYEQKYPYTDFDKINLDWILELATQLKEAAENGDFDGPPGPPGSGTATNGVAYFTTSDTFADIQAAISDGQLPVLMYYNMGTPCFLYCYDHTNSGLKFGALSNTQQLQLTWYSNDTKSFSTRTLISNQSPIFYGYPTLSSLLSPGDSSNKLATTSFVQNTVTTAVQAAIEQLVIAPFSESFKQALLQLARKVAYIDGNGQTYYQALYDALYPPINVDSISAVWNPPFGYVVYTTTPIDSLKTNLTVTATYDDQTTAVLEPTDYVLSGTLTAGTSTITVTYAGATTTFNVTVVANEVESIEATFTQGTAIIYDYDSLSDLVQYLTVTATYTNLNTVYVEYPDYTLSGTLTEGTSVITVSYAGKTDTFTVTVSVGLDSIAYGTKTYRDIFITDNLLSWFGNFENNFVISTTLTYFRINNQIVSSYAVSSNSPENPSVSSTVYNSPTHSLDVSATGISKYMNCIWEKEYIDTTKNYILAFACNVSNFVSGRVELQAFGNTNNVSRINQTADTNGWEPLLIVFQPDYNSSVSYYNFNFGALGGTGYGNANFTAYMDDLVFTPLPDGMTQAQALTAFSKYLEIVGRAS